MAFRLPSSSSESERSGALGDEAQPSLAELERSPHPQVRRTRGRPRGGGVVADALSANACLLVVPQVAHDPLPLDLFRQLGSETTQALVAFLSNLDLSKLSSDGHRVVEHFWARRTPCSFPARRGEDFGSFDDDPWAPRGDVCMRSASLAPLRSVVASQLGVQPADICQDGSFSVCFPYHDF